MNEWEKNVCIFGWVILKIFSTISILLPFLWLLTDGNIEIELAILFIVLSGWFKINAEALRNWNYQDDIKKKLGLIHEA